MPPKKVTKTATKKTATAKKAATAKAAVKRPVGKPRGRGRPIVTPPPDEEEEAVGPSTPIEPVWLFLLIACFSNALRP